MKIYLPVIFDWRIYEKIYQSKTEPDILFQ